jgi:hypothetical protein
MDGVVFHPDDRVKRLGFLNDGSHVSPTGAADQPVPIEDASRPEYIVFRTVCKLLEINPEDRLTVGCIFRRQLPVDDQQWYDEYFNDPDPDAGGAADVGSVKNPRPVFKFDSNFVAVANATIDDFRISTHLLDPGQDFIDGVAEMSSRYMPARDRNARHCYFEQGFYPLMNQQDKSGVLTAPVSLGTISWTELRPDWDPYRAVGIDLHASSRISMDWAVFPNHGNVPGGGADKDFGSQRHHGSSQDMNNRSRVSPQYWARGGIPLRDAIVPSGQAVGLFMYRARFQAGENLKVNNVTPYLLEVTVTALTPPRKLWFLIEY